MCTNRIGVLMDPGIPSMVHFSTYPSQNECFGRDTGVCGTFDLSLHAHLRYVIWECWEFRLTPLGR